MTMYVTKKSPDVDSQYCIFINFLFPLIHKYVPFADIDNKGAVPWTLNLPCELIRRKNDE